MTLEQLSYEYIKEADRLKARLCELKIMLKKAQTEEERTSLKHRNERRRTNRRISF